LAKNNDANSSLLKKRAKNRWYKKERKLEKIERRK
jgi:hypothetical protein